MTSGGFVIAFHRWSKILTVADTKTISRWTQMWHDGWRHWARTHVDSEEKSSRYDKYLRCGGDYVEKYYTGTIKSELFLLDPKKCKIHALYTCFDYNAQDRVTSPSTETFVSTVGKTDTAKPHTSWIGINNSSVRATLTASGGAPSVIGHISRTDRLFLQRSNSVRCEINDRRQKLNSSTSWRPTAGRGYSV